MPIVLTHCGKLGDMLFALPIGSWLFQTRGEKIHWVLPSCFPPFQYIRNLLLAQEMTCKVTLVSHWVADYACGGRPYRFRPADFGVSGEYYNIGFRDIPDKFVTAFYAEEHELGWDEGYTLNLGPSRTSDCVFRTEHTQVKEAVPQATEIPMPEDLLRLGRLLAGAKERHCWHSGIAALLYMARVPFHLYYRQGVHDPKIYHPAEYFGGSLITWIAR